MIFDPPALASTMFESGRLWAPVLLAGLLASAAAWDLRTGSIPNLLTYPAMAAGLAGHWICGGLAGDAAGQIGLAGAAGGLLAGGLPMAAAFLAGGLGGGDVKLMAAVGALGGWRLALAAMFYSFLAAAILGIAILLWRRRLWQTLQRIGWFFIVALGRAHPPDPARPDSPKLPFGTAIGLGTAAALVESFLRGGESLSLLGV
jgi:prepilin peptidase CpaA